MKLVRVYLLLVTSMFVAGCAGTALFFVNNLARFGDYTVISNINYGADKKQTLDIYQPSTLSELDKNNIVTVIFFYGGCWGACNGLTKDDYRFVAQAFTANEMIAVIVNYREFPDVKFPIIMADAKKSVEWVSDNIESYGGNVHNIILMGHSAGAHMASMLVFNEQYLKASTYKNIKGFIGLAGPYDFLPFDEWYQPELFSPPEFYATSQTINYVDGVEPASLLLYGNDDTRVKRRNIVSLTKEIKDKKGIVETHFYNDIGHAELIGALSIPYRSSKPVMNDIISFISKTVAH